VLPVCLRQQEPKIVLQSSLSGPVSHYSDYFADYFALDRRTHSESLFRIERLDGAERLRDALVRVGFTKAAFDELNRHGLPDLPVLMRLTASVSPLHNLMRLFRLAQPIAVEAACSALAPVSISNLVDVGLLRQVDGSVISEVALTPEADDLYVAHDFDPLYTGQAAPSNHVLEAGPSSQTLAALTIRRKGEHVLDLCAGAGIQSMLAAKHCADVTATDINRRALNFGAFNLRLNGITNVKFRHGNLYEPIDRESFDLVIANPPYIVSPRARFAYRDSGLPGDSICERVIREAPSHLREGGFAALLFNWHHNNEEDWAERPLSWTAGNGCDVWLLRFGTQSAVPYAFRWLRHGEGRNGSDLEDLLTEWVSYYEALGISLFSFGLVLLRRRSGHANWTRSETIKPEWTARDCSGQILRIFAAEDFLRQVQPDERFLAQRFALASEHEMRYVLHSESGKWVVTSATLSQTSGFGFTGRLDENVISLLAGCDGSRTLRELLVEFANRVGMDFKTVAPVGLEVMRSLMRSGFLVVPDHPVFIQTH